MKIYSDHMDYKNDLLMTVFAFNLYLFSFQILCNFIQIIDIKHDNNNNNNK